MQAEVITRRDDLRMRRLVLGPGEAMPWHTDACHRFSVIVCGQQLTIEFRETGEQIGVVVHPGMVGWPRNNIAVIERQIHALYGHVGVSHRRTLYNMYIL